MKRFAVTTLIALAMVATLIGSSFGTQSVRAATLGGLTIAPTSIDQTITPGGTYKGQVLLVDQGQAAVGYQVYASPYSVTGEDYKPDFQALPGAPNITTWFSFTKTDGTLQVGEQESIPFTVTVPSSTPAGSYYAAVFAQTADKSSGGVTTRTRVGTVMYIRVAGQAVEKGDLQGWSAPWLQRPPLTATLKIANSGTVHFAAQTKVTVSDIFGSTKFTFDREPKILPQKLRRISVPWDKGATFGLFKVGGEVKYLGKTEALPTKIVFIASPSMRILVLGIMVVFIVTMLFLGKTKVRSKPKRKPAR